MVIGARVETNLQPAETLGGCAAQRLESRHAGERNFQGDGDLPLYLLRGGSAGMCGDDLDHDRRFFPHRFVRGSRFLFRSFGLEPKTRRNAGGAAPARKDNHPVRPRPERMRARSTAVGKQIWSIGRFPPILVSLDGQKDEKHVEEPPLDTLLELCQMNSIRQVPEETLRSFEHMRERCGKVILAKVCAGAQCYKCRPARSMWKRLSNAGLRSTGIPRVGVEPATPRSKRGMILRFTAGVIKRTIGSEGVEPTPQGLKVLHAAVTPRPRLSAEPAFQLR